MRRVRFPLHVSLMESYHILPIREHGGFLSPPELNHSLDMIQKDVASNLAPVIELECILPCVK
jgi:hypothetical protein